MRVKTGRDTRRSTGGRDCWLVPLERRNKTLQTQIQTSVGSQSAVLRPECGFRWSLASQVWSSKSAGRLRGVQNNLQICATIPSQDLRAPCERRASPLLVDSPVGIVAFTILRPIASFFVLVCTPTARIYVRSLFFFLRSCLSRVASLPL